MRLRRALFATLALLAACAPPAARDGQQPGPAAPSTSDGRVNLSRGDSQVSISGDDSIVLRRQLRRLPDRYDEVLTLEDGMIEYLKFSAGRSGEDADGRVTIQRLLETDTYRELGLPAQPRGFKVGRNKNGEFDYAVVDGADLRCVLMSQFFGVALPGGGRTQELRVARCRGSDEPRAAALEADVLELIGRIATDGGALNRARPAEPPRGK